MYQCGVSFGPHPRPPRFVCDGCGAVYALDEYTLPPVWFLDGKPPRGWKGLRVADGSKRWDLCPRCWRPQQTPEAAPK